MTSPSYRSQLLILSRFRWAVCQLDVLRRLKAARAITEALKTLPETLDETYERLLLAILPEHRHLVRRVLLLLCGDIRNIEGNRLCRVDELLSLALADDEEFTGCPDNSLYNVEVLRDICGCLLTTTQKPRSQSYRYDSLIKDANGDDRNANPDSFSDRDSEVEAEGVFVYLAHYTVSEFLSSPRAASSDPTVAYFSMDPVGVHYECAATLFQATIQHSKRPESIFWKSRSQLLLRYGIGYLRWQLNGPMSWPDWLESDRSRLNHSLVWDFISGDYHLPWHEDLCRVFWVPRADGSRSRWDHHGAEESCFRKHWGPLYVYVRLMNNDLASLAEKFGEEAGISLLSNFYPLLTTPSPLDRSWMSLARNGTNGSLSPMIRLTKDDLPKLLIHCLGAYCFGSGGGCCPWIFSIKDESEGKDGENSEERESGCAIEICLRYGVDVNCTQYCKTPLQMAVERFDLGAVRLLLEHNADPNLVGADDGERPCGQEFTTERRKWSPLRLCRDAPCLLKSIISDYDEEVVDLCSKWHDNSRRCDNARPEIEHMLFDHGARDFEMSPDGVENLLYRAYPETRDRAASPLCWESD